MLYKVFAPFAVLAIFISFTVSSPLRLMGTRVDTPRGEGCTISRVSGLTQARTRREVSMPTFASAASLFSFSWSHSIRTRLTCSREAMEHKHHDRIEQTRVDHE